MNFNTSNKFDYFQLSINCSYSCFDVWRLPEFISMIEEVLVLYWWHCSLECLIIFWRISSWTDRKIQTNAYYRFTSKQNLSIIVYWFVCNEDCVSSNTEVVCMVIGLSVRPTCFYTHEIHLIDSMVNRILIENEFIWCLISFLWINNVRFSFSLPFR